MQQEKKINRDPQGRLKMSDPADQFRQAGFFSVAIGPCD
jgi:hypothetical protein